MTHDKKAQDLDDKLPGLPKGLFGPMRFETFAQASETLAGILDERPDIKEQFAHLQPLGADEEVKALPHYGCGGWHHLLGKVPAKFPMFVRCCDRCGHCYYSR